MSMNKSQRRGASDPSTVLNTQIQNNSNSNSSKMFPPQTNLTSAGDGKTMIDCFMKLTASMHELQIIKTIWRPFRDGNWNFTVACSKIGEIVAKLKESLRNWNTRNHEYGSFSWQTHNDRQNYKRIRDLRVCLHLHLWTLISTTLHHKTTPTKLQKLHKKNTIFPSLTSTAC